MKGTQSFFKQEKEARREDQLWDSLNSIFYDSLYIEQLQKLMPDVPFYANLRCGLWYGHKWDGTVYFKSTDGHRDKWSFSLSRLNSNLLSALAEHGAAAVVDSTRRGKLFPDALSKTIPIWACVVNRALYRLRQNYQNQQQHSNKLNTTLQSDTEIEKNKANSEQHLEGNEISERKIETIKEEEEETKNSVKTQNLKGNIVEN